MSTTREIIAISTFNSGVRLGELGRSEEEIAVYDELIAREGDRDKLALRARCGEIAQVLCSSCRGVAEGAGTEPPHEHGAFCTLLGCRGRSARAGDCSHTEGSILYNTFVALTSRRARGLSVAAAVVAVGAFVPATAQAAITLSHDPDPVEERSIRVTAAGTASPEGRLYVTSRPAGGQNCAADYIAEDALSDDILYSEDVSGSYSKVGVLTADDPGVVLICAYLQNSFSDPTPRDTGQIAIAVRSARATLSLSAPATIGADQPFTAIATGTAEFARQLYVTIRPEGAPCGSTYSIEETQANDLVFSQTIQGTFSRIYQVAGLTAGRYVQCAYVQENSQDLAPEATKSTVVQVGAPAPPPPPSAPLSLAGTASSQKVAFARTRGVLASVRGSASTRLYVTVSRRMARRLRVRGRTVSGRVLLGARTVTASATPRSYRLKLSATARRALRRRGRPRTITIQIEARASSERVRRTVHLR